MMSDMQNTSSEAGAAETEAISAAGEPGGRLSTAELQATLDRLETLSNENASLRADYEALQAENARLEDNWKRSEAEMANMRRRTEREIAENAKYAVSSFARDVIGIADNLRRAIEAVPKDAIAIDPALSALLEGVEVTERELFKVLERQNIVRFDPQGEKFDPHVHDAMMRIESWDQPPETIVKVIQAGYMIGERVLRAASVIVAKAGVGDPPPPPAQAEPESEEPAKAQSEIQEDAAEYESGESGMIYKLRPDGHVRSQARAQIIRPVVTGKPAQSASKKPSSMTRPVITNPSRDDDGAVASNDGAEYDHD